MTKIALLGSTGSIGRQTLDVVRNFPEKLKIVSLAAYSNGELLDKQSREFNPDFSALISRDGKFCLTEAVRDCDIAVVATRGIVALDAVLDCLRRGKTVALANKETLVCAGELVTTCAKQYGGKIVPVDSEHCAISQCLSGHDKSDVDKILLTASGGPFWEKPSESLHYVTAADALKHPNWSMGAKISIDSATMMNKVLEVIEAHFLFDVPMKDVQIVVHRQSIVHSMVRFACGDIMAQMAVPDMCLPIQLALLGESRRIVQNIDFDKLLTLTFERCDCKKFPCVRFAEEIENYPPLCRAAMNGANDACVEMFLSGGLAFDEFYPIILRAVNRFAPLVADLPMTSANVETVNAQAFEFVKKQGVLC